jgi:succinoglycan biosynthesis protein ExoV
MKLCFYRGKYPNFGDEINAWLLPKIFPGFFDNDDATLFLGIGSILFDHYPADSRKVVFGSGFGGYTAPPKFDETWLVYCVRGPRTAKACGLTPDKVAGDAAILMNRYRKRPRQLASRIAFMPHWESLERGDWQTACRLAGIHLIDPRRPVDEVLAEIEASAAIIAEAMHGAIVADALRVPWIPAKPLHTSHRFKWFDWAEALELKLSPHVLWPSTVQEAFVAVTQRRSHRLRHPSGMLSLGVQCTNPAFSMLAAARLRLLARREPMLSTDTALARALDRLESQAEKIKRDLGSC